MFRGSLPRSSFLETFNTNMGHVVHHLNILLPVVFDKNISIISVSDYGVGLHFQNDNSYRLLFFTIRRRNL